MRGVEERCVALGASLVLGRTSGTNCELFDVEADAKARGFALAPGGIGLGIGAQVVVDVDGKEFEAVNFGELVEDVEKNGGIESAAPGDENAREWWRWMCRAQTECFGGSDKDGFVAHGISVAQRRRF